MESRNIDMQAIFSELSERNKDIIILIAKSVVVAQDEQPHKPPQQIVWWENSTAVRFHKFLEQNVW